MHTTLKKYSILIGLAVSAALSLGVGGPAWAANDYKFETASPTSGATLTVRLVDAATGQPVTSTHVYAIHRQWLPTKSGLRFIDHRIALPPNADGTFTYQSNDVQAGGTVRLGAEVDDGSEIQNNIRVSE